MDYDFNLFVIGGGSGGIAAGRRAASYGAKVGLAENDRLGGTCVNRGCIPKKFMVYSSRFPSTFLESEGYGWSKVSPTFDWSKMKTAIDNELNRLNGIYQGMLDKAGVELFRGTARLIDDHTIEIGDRKVTAEKILIAVGGYPVKPDIPGKEYLNISDAMFELSEAPKRMIIVGAGYIAVEFACIMNGLGVDVTLVLRRDKILRGFDEDIRTEIQEAIQKHGIKVMTNSQPIGVEKKGDCFYLKLKNTEDGSECTLETDAVNLSATGRVPNIDNLGLKNTGVKVDKGAIVVDEYSKTSVENIYAVGDCTNRINLTPVAIKEGRAFADTEFGGKSWKMSYENVPSAIFTTPEAATVGMTEEEARSKFGDAVRIHRAKFRPAYHTITGLDEKVFMKLVVDGNSDRVLGAHMVGEHAGEIIQGVAIAVKMGAKKSDFDATVAIHPSIAEEFVTMS